jgi:hypothetical protein
LGADQFGLATPLDPMAFNPAQQVALRDALLTAFSEDDFLELVRVRLNIEPKRSTRAGQRSTYSRR